MTLLDRPARVRAVFFLHAVTSGGLYPRLAAIQQSLGLDVETLGWVFAGLAIGTLLTFFFVSWLTETVGTRTILVVTLPLLPIGTALLAAMPSALTLFLAFIAYGVLYALPNAAMNVEADRVEAATDRRVMNSCHGVWSLGYLLTTLLATGAEALHLSPFAHLGLLALPLAPIALWITLGIDPAPARPHVAPVVRHLALPSIAVLLLVVFATGPNLLEGGLRNWSVIYMRESFGAPSWVDTLTLPAFLVAQALGRLNADGWVMRYGAVPVARVLNGIAFLGGLFVVLSPNVGVALAGFLLIGLGVCTTYPLTTSAAARLGDRPASQNVASLTFLNQLVQLAAPPALGAIAAHFGIRSVFTVALPMALLSVWLARVLRPSPPTPPRG